jgi:AraC family transcriptional regulator
MHAWEAVQKTLNYIEEHINEEIQVEDLAEIAALSLFYYQRLFTRLVKKPVREYIKLRRLSKARDALCDKENRIRCVGIWLRQS